MIGGRLAAPAPVLLPRERRQRSRGNVRDPRRVHRPYAPDQRVAVLAAYQVAKEKSDPSQVSHLSDEVQEHFRMKAKAVERAYRMLGQ